MGRTGPHRVDAFSIGILAFLKRSFLPGQRLDETRGQVAAFLAAIAAAIALGVAILLVNRSFEGKAVQVISLAAILSTSLLCLVLVKRGKNDLAAHLLLWPLLAFIAFQATRSNGFHDSALFAIPGMIVLAGMIFRSLAFSLYSLACLAAVCAIILLELNGILANRFSAITEPADMADVAVIFAITAVTVRMLSRGLVRSLNRARASEARLRASLEEKDILLKEVHHRVKNNLQVISSMLSLGADDEAAAPILDSMMDRVHSMALVHERLYLSEDFAHVDFADYLRAMASNLMNSQARPGIECSVEAKPVLLGIDEAVPAGLILNELLTNALKHAFGGRSRGKLGIELSEEGGEVRLGVSDDGMGMDGPVAAAIAGGGTLTDPGKSLGHTLVRSLVLQLKGRLSVESSAATGSAFVLKFRKKG